MPVKSTNHKSPSPRVSPDSQLRSSSSSYHSASNYDDPEDASLPQYASNVEHAAPRTLVQSPQRRKRGGRRGDTSREDTLSQYTERDQVKSHSRKPSSDHTTARSTHSGSGSSSLATLGAAASKIGRRGSGQSSGRLSSGRSSPGRLSPGRRSPVSERLVEEFCEGVRRGEFESVERVLERGRMDVDMIISEKVHVHVQYYTCTVYMYTCTLQTLYTQMYMYYIFCVR